jgi:hypothetical protein
MPTISKDNNVVTLINIFTVEPAKQQQLIDLLIRATTDDRRTRCGVHFHEFSPWFGWNQGRRLCPVAQ